MCRKMREENMRNITASICSRIRQETVCMSDTGEDMSSPMYGVVTNCFRDTISFIRWDGMHSDFRQKTTRPKWASIRQSPQRKDRKSTRLNSSHVSISYAVFCLKKKNKK